MRWKIGRLVDDDISSIRLNALTVVFGMVYKYQVAFCYFMYFVDACGRTFCVADGKNCLIAAQVGIAGATVLEDEVILWGQVGVNKTITIGKGVEVLGQSGVTKSLPAGNGKYFGTPADHAMNKNREAVWLKRLPELWKKVMG